jgi:hypothetical protein
MSDYRTRAQRIVDRVLPALPAAHGWNDPAGFVAAAQRDGERSRLFWRTFARLRAKAEGGKPYIALPKDCPAVSEGIMGEVARELEAAQA